jgi:hypothetical protein
MDGGSRSVSALVRRFVPSSDPVQSRGIPYSSSPGNRDAIQKAVFFCQVVRAIDFAAIFKTPDCVKNLSEADRAKIRDHFAESNALTKVHPGDNFLAASRKRILHFRKWVKLLAQVIVLRVEFVILNAKNSVLLSERQKLAL